MSKKKINTKPDWINLPEFASDKSGGKIIFCSDEFFAPAKRVILHDPPIAQKNKLTKNGVWMDGWESKRKRTEGHDWCILQLPVACNIRGIEIDTAHFLGNYTPYVSIQGANNPNLSNLPKYKSKMGNHIEGDDLKKAQELTNHWKKIVKDTKLNAGYEKTRYKYITLNNSKYWTHLRINMLPDGGISRIRVYGVPDLRNINKNKCINLTSMYNGARVIYFNDSFFSHVNNLLLPKKSINMHDGWETARKIHRPKTLKVNSNNMLTSYGKKWKDWCVILLAGSSTISEIEVDTTHFKGNTPESFILEGCYNTNKNNKNKWTVIKERTKLKANYNNRFKIKNDKIFTHLRFSIIPDGGVSRLRVKGYLL